MIFDIMEEEGNEEIYSIILFIKVKDGLYNVHVFKDEVFYDYDEACKRINELCMLNLEVSTNIKRS